ncbi:MAG TPA: ParB/RepB/Spo0J family partition protein [Phycisphaerae bacterium]|nr:ParB/RepB/Spo0J family partition protein [Phycisphaerae bacterium]
MAKQDKLASSKPRLGRGLSSLIDNLTAAPPGEYASVAAQPQTAKAPIEMAPHAGVYRSIPIGRISANPFQPRQQFADADLENLAKSIAQHGVLQPLLVAPAKDPAAPRPFILIAGERRLRAAERAGLQTVPCIVAAPSREQILEWAVVENIHRSDLNPIERAAAYRQCMDRFNLTQAELADRLGQPRATVANYLRILDLQDSIHQLIVEGTLSFGHAKVLAGLLDRPEVQCDLARKAAKEGLSVREIETLVAAAAEGEPPVGPERARPGRPAYLRDVEERLSAAVGTRVAVLPRRAKDTGRIVIEYYSLDDFDRIASRLGLPADAAELR